MRLRSCAAIALGLCLATRAAAIPLITLDTVHTSSVDASVYSTIPADYNTTANIVTALPYTAPSTANGATGDFSTVTPALSESALNFTYSQNLANPADYYADGDGDIFFIAGLNTAYTFNASETTSQATDMLTAELNDRTTNQQLFDVEDIDSLSMTVGPLTGVLTFGDTYELYVDENLSNPVSDPTLAGSATMAFSPSLPEPTVATLLLFPLIAARRPKRPGSQFPKRKEP